MPRTKKADQAEQAEAIVQGQETEEHSEDAVQERETEEQDEEAAQEPDMFADLPNPCVYCGPSVKGVVRQYTTYQGGIPDTLREFIQTHPDTLGLIVSTEEFPSMRKRLETRGTREAELYRAVKAGT